MGLSDGKILNLKPSKDKKSDKDLDGIVLPHKLRKVKKMDLLSDEYLILYHESK